MLCKSTSQENNQNRKLTLSHLCWWRGRHVFSAKGSFVGRSQIRDYLWEWQRLKAESTCHKQIQNERGLKSEYKRHHRPFFLLILLHRCSKFRTPTPERWSETNGHRLLISQDDFMELCQSRLEKRKPSPWPLGTTHLSLAGYKPDYRKTGEPKPHILSFFVMPLKKSYCVKIPYFLFLKFICRLWDLVRDLELAIRGGSGSHTEHPPSAKWIIICELSFFCSLSSILLSIYLPTYLLIYQPPSLSY